MKFLVTLITVNIFTAAFAAVSVREAWNVETAQIHRPNYKEPLSQDELPHRPNYNELWEQAWDLEDQFTGSHQSYTHMQDDTCSGETDEFLAKAVGAATTEAKVELLEKDILPKTIKSEISDKIKDTKDSEAEFRSVYESLAKHFEARVTDGGFKDFAEAVSEISVAKEEACAEFEGTRKELSHLIEEFVKTYKLEKKDKHLLESSYGKLLCLKDHAETHIQDEYEECKCPPDGLKSDFSGLAPCSFFDCLNNTEVIGKIFFSALSVDIQCLAFVIDTTGSMWEEIRTAKSIILNFLKSEQDIGIDGCYILVPFNDVGPDHEIVAEKSVGPITYAFSHDAEDLRAFYDNVQNLNAYGGGDWPEYSFYAMNEGLKVRDREFDFPLMVEGSQMVVLTDADSKQPELKQAAIDLANDLNVCIHFFSAYHLDDYQNIADATHGTMLSPFNQWQFAKFAASYASNPCEYLKDKLTEVEAAESCKSFSVSLLAGNLRIVANTPRYTSIVVTRPDSKKIEKTAVDSNLAFFVEKDPTSGSWSVCSKNGNPISAEIAIDYLFDVSIFYYTESSKKMISSVIPPACSAGKITVVTSIHKDIKSAFLKIVEGGKIIQNIKLTKNCEYGYFLSDTVNFPDATGSYVYHFAGTDTSGHAFEYKLKSVIKYKELDIEAFHFSDAVEVSGKLEVEFFNTWSYDATFSFSASPSISVSPSSESVVMAGRSLKVRVEPGSSKEVMITAKSACTGQVVKKTIIVESSTKDECGGCLNGGKCIVYTRRGRKIARCQCPPGYGGSKCQTKYSY